MSKTIYVGLDIDATVIAHCYPGMTGEDIGAVPWLLRLQEEFPVAFLLNTMRSGLSLQLAMTWLEANGIKVAGVGVHPTQAEWTESPKCHCHVYIDDRAVGTPLRDDMSIDWDKYGPMVLACVGQWDAPFHRYGLQNGHERNPRAKPHRCPEASSQVIPAE